MITSITKSWDILGLNDWTWGVAPCCPLRISLSSRAPVVSVSLGAKDEIRGADQSSHCRKMSFQSLSRLSLVVTCSLLVIKTSSKRKLKWPFWSSEFHMFYFPTKSIYVEVSGHPIADLRSPIAKMKRDAGIAARALGFLSSDNGSVQVEVWDVGCIVDIHLNTFKS